MVCKDCRRHYGRKLERGLSGLLFEREARAQIYNLLILFGLLSAIVWAYYLTVYSDVDQNERDNYVFVYIVLIAFVCDEIYFIYRYINLYTELCETNEIISEDEIQDISTRTYLRAYIMCDDALYVNTHAIDLAVGNHEVIDTPYQSKRYINGLTDDEVQQLIESALGVQGGELRFFFGRKMGNVGDRSLLRYFYFMEGKAEDYPKLKLPGEWMQFSDIKKLYKEDPNKFALLFTSDLIRLSTIIVTSKTYDSEGRRRNSIRAYRPNFTLRDVRECNLDFQDDKWIEISKFNADTPFYTLKRFWKQIKGKQLPAEQENETVSR